MIPIKTTKEIETMKEGGKILADIMEKIKKEIVPGKKTIELNRLSESLLFKYGKPSFKNYRGFPFSLCTSINQEIVHGLPSDRKLKEGDIISLDLGLFYKSFHLDMATTVPVGNINPEILRLITVTKKAFKRGIKKVREGNTFGDVGNTIQRYVESQKLKVVKNLCGHGIGRELHEEPDVLNYGQRKKGPEIKKGMVFCIEPIVSMGSPEIELSQNKYTYKTRDDSLVAHYEHTVAVTNSGTEILTEL